MNFIRRQVRRFARWLLKITRASADEPPNVCLNCGCRWDEHEHICPTAKATTVDQGSCEVCGIVLPPGTLRTHDGRLRCAAHKSVWRPT